ncbi:MAG TPA: L,D-transpeptidase [Conexibacter sp.]|jgi:lipoprotein-anchoring transpeptidase ErfK/SrfK|nr:L,D-transpeptidase [Conexibacter sp.]
MSAAARRLGFALAAAGLVVVGLVVGSLLVPGSGSSAPAGSGAGGGSAASVSTRVRGAGNGADSDTGVLRMGVSLVANVRGTRPFAVYRRLGATRPTRRLAGPAARVYLVRERRPGGWLRVLLPVRPNGASGWIRARRVELRTNPYRIDVHLRAHRLVVRRGDRTVLRTPIGVGRAATPTPRGIAYVTRLLRQPDPHGAYGPWAFGLSVYSPVLTSFGGGPGEVGIHGTDAPAGIGRDVSHGCIRLPNAAIERLARTLPLGTPVRIA